MIGLRGGRCADPQRPEGLRTGCRLHREQARHQRSSKLGTMCRRMTNCPRSSRWLVPHFPILDFVRRGDLMDGDTLARVVAVTKGCILPQLGHQLPWTQGYRSAQGTLATFGMLAPCAKGVGAVVFA